MSIHYNINIGSYNTLILKSDDGKDEYTRIAKGGVLYGEDRQSRYGNRIANRISQLNCDCIALQEVNQASFNILAEKLWQKGYAGIFSNRNNGEDEGVAIFYKTHQFEVFSNHTNYFNDGTGRGIFDLGLRLKENPNATFHCMTSHIDYRSEYMQNELNTFADYVSKIAGPKIICGDFNTTPDNSCLRSMWDKQLTDSFYGQYAPTFFDRRIDYILTSPEIASVFNSKVIGDPRKLSTAEEPSDHLPLVTTIQLTVNVPEPIANKQQIIVKCDPGFGNKLFIRGDGPEMSWEKGIELRNIDKETWVFETQADLPFEYKIIFNDENWETGYNHKTECHKNQEINPQFDTQTKQIIVKCDAGFGNKLFIRGDGPGMGWEKEKGIELRCIDKDTWVFETQTDLPFEYKVLLNNEDWEIGYSHKTEWNRKQEVSPKFQE